jgi:hypothetical protein
MQYSVNQNFTNNGTVVLDPTVTLYMKSEYLLAQCNWTEEEGLAAKSAEEERHSNHNMRAHLGEIYNNSNNQSSSFPNYNKS